MPIWTGLAISNPNRARAEAWEERVDGFARTCAADRLLGHRGPEESRVGEEAEEKESEGQASAGREDAIEPQDPITAALHREV